jgi:YidC/Oxa1 family membrane protein insertase
MGGLFNELLYRPFLNALILLYENIAFQDLGVAIILLTIVIRFVLFPIFQKGMRHQRISQEMQPELKKIQKKHKENPEEQAKQVFALYRKYNMNPFTPFLLILVQLPILIGLYQVFRNVGEGIESFDMLYTFVPDPVVLEPVFLNIVNLAEPSILLAGIAAAAQFIQARLALPKRKGGDEETQAEKIGRNMMYIGPVLTLAILWHFPAAIGIYWITTTIFSIIQQIVINKSLHNEGIGANN